MAAPARKTGSSPSCAGLLSCYGDLSPSGRISVPRPGLVSVWLQRQEQGRPLFPLSRCPNWSGRFAVPFYKTCTCKFNCVEADLDGFSPVYIKRELSWSAYDLCLFSHL